MGIDVSVVVLTYFPDRAKLLTTIKSVLMQRKVSYEIIIADDGSDDFFRSDIENMMQQHSFTDFKFVVHSKNQGTVMNFYDAVKEAKGEIIKPISHGDYFYESDTLYKVYRFMKEHDADAAFGDIVYYSNKEEFEIFDRKTPVSDRIFLNYKNYNSKKIAKALIQYSDFICGASLFYKASTLAEYLSRVIGTLIYAEDAITQFFALENKKILKYDGFVVFYETSGGISANSGFGSNIITEDFIRFYEFLSTRYPKNSYLKFAKKRFYLTAKNEKLRYYWFRLTSMNNAWQSIKRKFILKRYRCKNYSLDFFNQINRQ